MSSLSHKDRALQRFQSGDVHGAARAFGEALAEQESAELWNDWATCQFHAGRFNEAEEGFRQALVLDGTKPDIVANLGLLLHKQGRRSEAKDWLEKALRELPAESREPIAAILVEYRKIHPDSQPCAESPSVFLHNVVGNSSEEQVYFEARLGQYCEILKALPGALPGQRLLEVGAKYRHLTPAFSALKAYEVRCAVQSTLHSQSVAHVFSKNKSQEYCFTVDNIDLQSFPWPYLDAAFDVIVCTGVIEDLVGSPEDLLAEMSRVLRPSGLLLLSVPSRSSQVYLQQLPTRIEIVEDTKSAPDVTRSLPSSDSLVCLQTMWRSGGTYVWSKFRADGRFRTYDEPCHERLLTETPAAFEEESRTGITNKLRHPELDRHYFAEFPFQEKGGVEFFRKRFSYEDYYLPPDAEDSELTKYVGNLISKAHQSGQRPLAKPCRFGLRAAWLKKQFAPISLYLLRNPDAMFRSYWSLGGRESYFFAATLLITSQNQKLPIFLEFAEHYDIPFIQRETVEEEIGEAQSFVRTLDDQSLRDLLLLHWALTFAHNAAISDHVIDIDLLASDQRYRTDTQDVLASLLAFPVRFDDVKHSLASEAPGAVASTWGLSAVNRALRFLQAPSDRCRNYEISSESARALEAIYAAGERQVHNSGITAPRSLFENKPRRYSPEELERLLATVKFLTVNCSTSANWPAHFRKDLLSFASRGVPIANCGDQVLCVARKPPAKAATIPDSISPCNSPCSEIAVTIVEKTEQTADSAVVPRRVLVIHEQLPQPTKNGSDVRLMQILRELRAQGHEVTFLARKGAGHEQGSPLLRELGIDCWIHDSERLHCFGEDDPVRWLLQDVLQTGQFDVAILALWFWRSISIPEHYLHDIRRISPQTRIAVLTDDQHGLREQRMAELSNRFSDYERAKDYAARESEVYRQADFVLSISEDDRRGLLRNNPELAIDLFPMVAELAPMGADFGQKADFLFVGNFGNPANKDGVAWLLNEVWPEVRRRLPSAKISLVGDHIPTQFAGADGVQVLGHVVDLDPLFAQRRVFVAPIRFGTGIKTKNLSALAHGLPLVTTTVGAEGLNLQNGTHALIADTSQEFARQLYRSYTDQELWTALTHNSRAHVRREFGHERLRQAVRDLMKQVSSTTPRPYEASLEFSVRAVETRFPEVLTYRPTSYRVGLRLCAYATLAEECMRQGQASLALAQLRHMFSMTQEPIYESALFRHTRKLMAECYQQLGDVDQPTPDVLPKLQQPIAPAVMTRSNPELSVIIPTYNRKSALRACLSHLASQSLPAERWEVIVVDDGCDDGTAEVIQRIPRFCHLEYVQQQHSGAGSARRAGVEHARGEFLLFMNDETTAYSNLLAEHLRMHHQHKAEKIAVLGGRNYAREAAESAITFFLAGNPLFFSQAMLPDGLQSPQYFFFGHNLSAPREAVLQAGSFDPDFHFGDDVELGIRLAAAGYRVLFQPLAGSAHDYVHEDIPGLLQKARTCGAVQWKILRKHPHLLRNGAGPFGMLDQTARRRVQALVKENRGTVREGIEQLNRLNSFDFTPFLDDEVRSKRPAEILATVKTLVPQVFWFAFFESFLEMWAKPRAAKAGLS